MILICSINLSLPVPSFVMYANTSSVYEIQDLEQDIFLDRTVLQDMFDELYERSSSIASVTPPVKDLFDELYFKSLNLVVHSNDFKLLKVMATSQPSRIRIITQLILGSKDPLRNYIQSQEGIKDIVKNTGGSVNNLAYIPAILYSSYYDPYIQEVLDNDSTTSLKLLSERDLWFDKIVILAALHASYTVQKGLNYNESVEEFYDTFKDDIRSFLSKDIFSKKDFIDIIYIANLFYPFSFYNLNSELLLNWNGAISFQRKWSLDYKTFLKLEANIGFSLDHLKLFDPIFFASSLLRIANDPYISLKHKAECITMAQEIFRNNFYEKATAKKLNPYIALAVADILKYHTTLFDGILKNTLAQNEPDKKGLLKSLEYANGDSPRFKYYSLIQHQLASGQYQTTLKSQKSTATNYSINGLFLRAVACGANRMVAHMLYLNKKQFINLPNNLIKLAIQTAISYGQEHTLEILLTTYPILITDPNELVDIAAKNLQYEILSFFAKKSTIFSAKNRSLISSEIEEKLQLMQVDRFNILRNYSNVFDCKQIFSTPPQQ